MKKMSKFLPPDVLIDILARLPIKCLVQCIVVSKSWYSLITDPTFITKHHNHSAVMNKDNKLIIVRSCNTGQNEAHYSLRYENQTFGEYAKVRFPLTGSANYQFRITGCCNGVVCFSDDEAVTSNDLYLWNPLIQKLVALPPVRVTFKSHDPFTHHIGFGFDSLKNEYKIVRIVNLHYERIPAEIDIYTLSTDTWRNISHLNLQYIIEDGALLAYLNGAAHWIAFDRRGDPHCQLIVSFHMGDEVFREIMLPVVMNVKSYDPLILHVAKFLDSLSLFELVPNGFSLFGCIWVMKEYGVATSWTKQVSIDMDKIHQSAVLSAEGHFVFCDPDLKQLDLLETCGSEETRCKKPSYAYTESLVLLGVKPPLLHVEETEDDGNQESNAESE